MTQSLELGIWLGIVELTKPVVELTKPVTAP